MRKKHAAIHTQQSSTAQDQGAIKRIRPVRIAAVRQREMMAIISEEENSASADWLDEEELDLGGIRISADVGSIHNAMPIVTMVTHFSCPWEDEQ